jgi:YVTN family beta-propeller protein
MPAHTNDTSADPNRIGVAVTAHPNTSWRGDTVGLQAGNYAVRVIAWNDNGFVGGFSDPQTFTVGATNLYSDIIGGFAPQVAGLPARVYVPNSVSNTVSVVDPATFNVIDSFPVGAEPQHITPAWDLSALYVNNTSGNSLTQIDPHTGRPVATIAVTDPYNLYFTPDGRSAIVVAEAFNRLDFRDPHSFALQGSVPIPGSGADHLDFSADGSYLLISTEYDGHAVRVDLAARRVTGDLVVGGKPIDVKVSPDGTVFYVANQGRGGVSVVDPVSMREIAFLTTGFGAHGFAVSRDTRSLYVSNRLDGSVSVIDFATRQVVATWHVGGSPDMLQVSPDGQQLWASNRFHDTVSVISTSTGQLLRTIPMGSSPHGLTYFPQPGRFCIGHTASIDSPPQTSGVRAQ